MIGREETANANKIVQLTGLIRVPLKSIPKSNVDCKFFRAGFVSYHACVRSLASWGLILAKAGGC